MKWLSKAFIFLSMIPAQTWAYPVYFKCEGGGRLSDQITPQEIASQLRTLTRANVAEFCAGAETCMQELSQLLTLTVSAGKITQEVMTSQLASARERASALRSELEGISPINQNLFASLAEYNRMLENVALARECRVATTRIDPEDLKENEGCLVANFHHSPYMYTAGVRESGVEGGQHAVREADHSISPPAACSDVDAVINHAVTANQDPYAALAISFMENGTGVRDLELDPVGAVETIGCPTTRATEANHNLESFGTYHNARFGIVENPKLLATFERFLKQANQTAFPGESFYCMGNTTEAELGFKEVLTSEDRRTKCCIEVPYFFTGNQPAWAETFSHALTYASMDRYIKSPLEDNIRGTNPNEYPARRLQRFNGYSDSMGGAEGVSAWRSGVNYYQTPAYGYQAMDFIVNSLWSNPYIRAAVKKAEESNQTISPSVLCQDRATGTYSLDHNFYFNKHANAPRMSAIMERRKSRPRWNDMSPRDKNVLRGELVTLCSDHIENYSELCRRIGPVSLDIRAFRETRGMTLEESQKMEKALTARLNAFNLDNEMRIYFRDIFPLRRTIRMANEMDQGYTWGDMNESQFDAFKASYDRHILRR